MTWGEIAFVVYLTGIVFIVGTFVGAAVTNDDTPSCEELGQMVTVTVLWPFWFPTAIVVAWLGSR